MPQCLVSNLPNNQHVGLVIDAEYALRNSLVTPLTVGVINDMRSRALTEDAIGKIPVVIDLPDAPGGGRRVYFQFKEMVESSSEFKNALVIFPNTIASGGQSGLLPKFVKTPELPKSATVMQHKDNSLMIVAGENRDGTLRKSIIQIRSNGTSRQLATPNGVTDILTSDAAKAVVLTPKWSEQIKNKYSEAPALIANTAANFYEESVPDLEASLGTLDPLVTENYIVVVLLDNWAQSWPSPVQFTANATKNPTNPKYDGCSFHPGSSMCIPTASEIANGQVGPPETLFKNNLLAANFIFFKQDGSISSIVLCDNAYSNPWGNFDLHSSYACTASRRRRLQNEIVGAEYNGDHKFDHINSYRVPYVGSTASAQALFGTTFFSSNGYSVIPPNAQFPTTNKIIVGPL